MTATTWKKKLAAGLTAAGLTAGAGVFTVAAPAHADVPAAQIGQTQDTPHFRVTTRSVEPVSAEILRVDVEVCAKVPAGQSSLRVSWEPWSLLQVDGRQTPSGNYEAELGWENYPYADGATPEGRVSHERHLVDGQCASGAVGFAHGAQPKQLIYHNGFGETVAWNLDD